MGHGIRMTKTTNRSNKKPRIAGIFITSVYDPVRDAFLFRLVIFNSESVNKNIYLIS